MMKISKSIIFLTQFLLLTSTVGLHAKELNLEIQHEDDPSDMISNEQDNENNLLPPLMEDSTNKKITVKGDVLITEDIVETREVDGAEIKVQVKTD